MIAGRRVFKGALLASAAALVTVSAVNSASAQASLPKCTALASQILATYNDITAATSTVQPATASTPSFCFVLVTVSDLSGPAYGYQAGQNQAINVGIGLPLSTADGGSGGVQGAWNGRIQDLGGGGYAGGIVSANSVLGSTNPNGIASGYATSFTDTGHVSTSGNFIFNADGTFNTGIVNDFIYAGIHAQAVWNKKLVLMYYGMAQKYAYWNGCSTGGRQGHQQAQRYPNDYDGIYAGSSAFNWDRFQMGELWGQVVMNQELGASITAAKQAAVTNAAVGSCQNKFGGTADGLIQDWRSCTYSPTNYICGVSTATVWTVNATTGAYVNSGTPDTTNCLTQGEAAAVAKIWQGPTGSGANLWPGLERGGPFSTVDGPGGPSLTSFWGNWIYQNPNWQWQTLNETSFQTAFTLGETVGHIYGTDDPNLSKFKAHGGKIITSHGLADPLIFSGNTYEYYDRVAAANGGFANTQQFYRFFPYPGNGHCAAASATFPNAPVINFTDLFAALTNWVENGVAPDTIAGYNNATHASATVTRPLCMHPNTLTYNGTGSILSASSFTCTPQTTDSLSIPVLPNTGKQARYTISNTHDFNADGFSDILWRDASGNVGIWLMNGSSVLQSTVLGQVASTWAPVGQRQLAANSPTSPFGASWIIWRDAAGDTGLWQMNGTAVVGTTTLSPGTSGWSIVATGDFNMDGYGDILWQDPNGNLAVWFMNGGQVLSTTVVGKLPTNWTVVGGDMRGWVFLRNTVTNEVGVWVLANGQVAQAMDFGAVPAQWSIAGIGDFDNNGFSDIAFRDSSGNVGIWLLNNTYKGPFLLSSAVLGNIPLTWSVTETGDYNGDGNADILWQDNKGNLGAWLMNGTTILSAPSYGNVGTSWTVQAVNAD
jgi:hypothetical protein